MTARVAGISRLCYGDKQRIVITVARYAAYFLEIPRRRAFVP